MSTTSPTDAGPPRGRDEVRAAIIDAATRLMAERGPSVSTREIAAEAGVNRGLLHRHVGSKEALIAEVLKSGAERFAETIGTSPVETLSGLVGSMFAEGDDAEPLTRLIAWVILEGAGSAALAETPLVLQHIRNLMIEHAGGRSDTTPEMATALLMAALMGWQLFAPALLPMLGGDRDPATSRRELESVAELLGSHVMARSL